MRAATLFNVVQHGFHQLSIHTANVFGDGYGIKRAPHDTVKAPRGGATDGGWDGRETLAICAFKRVTKPEGFVAFGAAAATEENIGLIEETELAPSVESTTARPCDVISTIRFR
eukprot:5186778-Pleurochrysis_carterae.AAC.1